MQRIYLKDRSFAIDNLPSETGLLVELIDLCNDGEATFDKYAATIKKDAGLTAQFLRIANSPLYKQWNEITDLKRMLIVLGLKNVRKIIITSAVQNFFSKINKDNDPLLQQLWLRSLVCGQLAEKIAIKINYPKSEEAYLAGLLHQIGILLLLVNYKENYRQVLEQYETNINFCQLENDNYGINHCEVGATLVESWQLDSLISDAILFQGTDPKELRNSPVLLKIIAVAGPMSSPPNTDAKEQDVENAKHLLKLPQDEILTCLADALDDCKQILTGLGFSADALFAETIIGNEADKVREHNSSELAERVKSITLTHCFMNGESDSAENLIKELRINFDLLFNLKQLCFFRQKGTTDTLVPCNDLKVGKLDEIRFALNDQNSAIVKCFNDNQVLDSTTQQCSISDSQVIRILGAEAAYFLPVGSPTGQVGVLVLGSSRKELANIKEKLALIKLLLGKIGPKYSDFTSATVPEENISMTEFNKIVHEVKNPLTIINNYLYILNHKLDEGHPAKEDIDFIKEEMDRVGTILAKARDREQAANGAQQTDINKLVEELNDFFCNSLYNTKRITASLTLDNQIPILPCPENSLKQIIINIVKNAVEAMPNSGNIEINTRDNCFQNGSIFVELAIKDNGPGMPVKILQNLFKPVESTKKGHSGLGLSIVAELINEMSGTISCYSSEGSGTEFKILLPRIAN